MIDIVVIVMKCSDGINAVCGEGWVASINNISRAAIEGEDIMIETIRGLYGTVNLKIQNCNSTSSGTTNDFSHDSYNT